MDEYYMFLMVCIIILSLNAYISEKMDDFEDEYIEIENKDFVYHKNIK